MYFLVVRPMKCMALDRYTISSATAEIVRDAHDVDSSVDDVYSALTLACMHAPPKQTVLTNRKTTIQGHSRSSVVVPIDAAYMTFY